MFFKDKNLYQAVKAISDIDDLKCQMVEYSVRLVAQEREQNKEMFSKHDDFRGEIASDNE